MAMSKTGWAVRMAISVLIDLADFTLGRLPILGSVGEGVSAILLVPLWGPSGLIYFAELLDFTEQIDGFIPTASLIGLYIGWREGLLGGEKSASALPKA